MNPGFIFWDSVIHGAISISSRRVRLIPSVFLYPSWRFASSSVSTWPRFAFLSIACCYWSQGRANRCWETCCHYALVCLYLSYLHFLQLGHHLWTCRTCPKKNHPIKHFYFAHSDVDYYCFSIESVSLELTLFDLKSGRQSSQHRRLVASQSVEKFQFRAVSITITSVDDLLSIAITTVLT